MRIYILYIYNESCLKFQVLQDANLLGLGSNPADSNIDIGNDLKYKF
jgi:hypothetical protein